MDIKSILEPVIQKVRGADEESLLPLEDAAHEQIENMINSDVYEKATTEFALIKSNGSELFLFFHD